MESMTDKHHAEEEEQVGELERVTSSFRLGGGLSSLDGSTITTNHTRSSSSGSSEDGVNEEKKKSEYEYGSTSKDKEDEKDQIIVLDDATGYEINEEDMVYEYAVNYDVENVLLNQNTHHLACPTCKSCLTKKIIIIRKKQKTPPPREDVSCFSIFKSIPTVMFKCLSCFNIFEPKDPLGQQVPVERPIISPNPSVSVLPEVGVEGSKTETKPEEVKSAYSWIISIFTSDNKGNKVIGAGSTSELIQPLLTSDVEEGNPNLDKGPTGETLPVVVTPAVTPVVTLPAVVTPVVTLPVVVTPIVPEERKPEILKSIVYGGLIEAITSLGVISSAAGSGATTLNILVLGLANLLGGLILIVKSLQEIKDEETRRTETNQTNGQDEGRYNELLGQRKHFILHAFLAILTFIIVGLMPPIIYYFSFTKTHNKDYTMASVFGSSLIVIFLLSIAKASVSNPRDSNLKIVMSYVTTAVLVPGISYAAGSFAYQFLEKYGWSEDGSDIHKMMISSLMGRKAGFGSYSSSY